MTFRINRIVFMGLILLCIALGAISCGQGHPTLMKMLYFPVSKPLDEHTMVVLKDAWIYENGTSNALLRARFTFEGDNPGDKYTLKAALRAEEKGEDIKSIFVWYVGLQPLSAFPTNRIEMFWEFKNFPTNTPKIYLREDYIDPVSGRVAKSLDFILPGTRDLRILDAHVN